MSRTLGTPRLAAPDLRGWKVRDGGYAAVVDVPPQWRGSTTSLAGLRPFPSSPGTPTLGVPLGPALGDQPGAVGPIVCADPISWFERGKLLGNPSAFVLGMPGLGKSTVVRRWVLGLAAAGVTPLILGDLKPDYTALIGALGGQVIRLGRGAGVLNVLDPGGMAQVADRLPSGLAAQMREEAHTRRVTMVTGLLALARASAPSEQERLGLTAALRELAIPGRPTPVLGDLMALLHQPTPGMLAATLVADPDQFAAQMRTLLHSMRNLLDSPLGAMFNGPTTTRLDLSSPALAVDVSGVPDEANSQAAALLAVWADGFGAVEAANALTDAGLAPQRRFLIVLDELWRAIRAGAGMVDRLDALTRLNRAHGVGQVMITHSLADLDALPDPADRAKASGFVERAGMLLLGGLPHAELDSVRRVVDLTEAEARLVTSWSSPPSLAARRTAPPGVGHFLLKVGGRPGVPFVLRLTDAEIAAAVHDTNQRWAGTS
jgi:hypothetical protein